MMTADGGAPPADMVLEQLLTERHSCRGFLPDPVPRATLRRLLELAQKTASWCNSQPWQVILTSGKATERFREGLCAYTAERTRETGYAVDADFPFPEAYEGIYRERRRECGFQLYDCVGVRKGDRAASARQANLNYTFFGAPHVAIITTPAALGVYGGIDCGGYVTNFMMAAQSLGLATIAQAALAAHAPYLRRHFKLPDDRLVVCGISFGYEDTAHPANGFRTRRVPIDEAVAWQDE